MSEETTDYDKYVRAATQVQGYNSFSNGRDSVVTIDNRGITYAILALAEALRPQATRVDVQINTDQVKAAVREGLENRHV